MDPRTYKFVTYLNWAHKERSRCSE